MAVFNYKYDRILFTPKTNFIVSDDRNMAYNLPATVQQFILWHDYTIIPMISLIIWQISQCQWHSLQLGIP